jgi:hypothetical protein
MLTTDPLMHNYVHFREEATYISVASLRSPRQIPDTPGPINALRVRRMAIALYRLEFNYANLIQWLQGAYN